MMLFCNMFVHPLHENCYTGWMLVTIPPPGTPSSVSSPGPRRRLVAGPRAVSPDSVSSGYSTASTAASHPSSYPSYPSHPSYLPVDSELLDTGDYELWDRRQQLTGRRDWARPPHREVGASYYIACMA